MRHNIVLDVLSMLVASFLLLICGNVPASTGWQSGRYFLGGVEFGGVITPYDDSLPPWLWKTGGYTGFSNKISELTGNGTRLTVSAPYDLLLLAGKSARAFEGSETSGAGIVPVIQLKGSDGSEIHIQWARGTPGQGLLVLPLSVTGDTQTAGTLAAEVQAFGALAWAEDDGFGARITQTQGNNSADAYVFNGGVPDSSTWRTADGVSFISRMTGGEVSAESIWAQLRQIIPGMPDSPVMADESGYQDLVGEGWFYSGAYALGISSGAVLNLHFSKPVTGQSVWRAGMTVIIRYA
ncbi:fimbrial [Escherichia coli]|nr:fimbrial [Salmonella enterica]EDE2185690.1 fimbrial [Salmonella enterica]EGK6400671.1 fimbrial [Salmonella enterica]EHO7059204.1 fimbrial [Escherichia coli]HAO6592118.1 fimbrial [Escherichia coli]